MRQDEEVIDLARLAQIFGVKKFVVAVIIAVCMAVAAFIGIRQPTMYESTSILQINEDAWNIASVAYSSEKDENTKLYNYGTVLTTYIQIMKFPAVNKDAVNFDVKNIRGTNLISISAKGKTAEEARQAANGIIDNFLAFQT